MEKQPSRDDIRTVIAAAEHAANIYREDTCKLVLNKYDWEAIERLKEWLAQTEKPKAITDNSLSTQPDTNCGDEYWNRRNEV